METVEEFLARGGKITEVPPSKGRTLKQIQDEVNFRRINETHTKIEKEKRDALTNASMRSAENREGCYSPYWGEE